MTGIGLPCWEEPRICKGCTTTPCTEDPSKCLNDFLEAKGEEEFERMKDER